MPTNTGYHSPSANAAGTGGDRNGFERNPSRAYQPNDGLSAMDRNSGTSTSTSCTDSGKDSHQYYNYGLAIPSGAAIM